MATATKKRSGIDCKNRQQLLDLQATLEECLHIEEVYFTDKGDHYFNVHELMQAGKKGNVGTGKFYGSFKLEDVVYKTVGERKYYRKTKVHTPHTLITTTLTREEILDHEFNGPDEMVQGKAVAITATDPTVAELMRQVAEMSAKLSQLTAAAPEVKEKAAKA